jgi:sigma-B regulation protein RsbU (phosphoserine phosphatase)
MADVAEGFLREQLLTRRQKLESALATVKEDESLAQLLNEVDSALGRMEAGTYGICEECHDPVEKDRLLADPLMRYCIDHLTQSQRRALEEDLQLAAQLQRELLPKQHLSFGGWQVSYHYQPLGMVSGDYCDVVIHEDGSKGVFFALGDASGKGVAASMLMAQLHAILRTLIATGLPVQALVERAGRVFCESTMPTFFATLICGRAGVSGEIEICNAGHCPALLVQAGKVSRLEATGVPLGLFCDGTYPPHRVQLAPGDTLFLYTDGLSEARSSDNEEYGEGRLAEVMAQRHGLAAHDLIPACLEDLREFRRGAPLADDLTLMTIRRVS